jgi:hypothetical protein
MRFFVSSSSRFDKDSVASRGRVPGPTFQVVGHDGKLYSGLHDYPPSVIGHLDFNGEVVPEPFNEDNEHEEPQSIRGLHPTLLYIYFLNYLFLIDLEEWLS